jgi:hypothetical protein
VTRGLARLREESGQSLVFFVMLMTTLFALAALVVNVGNWLQAKQRLQGVTDSAALSAVQEDPHDIFAGLAASQTSTADNWPGTSIDNYRQVLPQNGSTFTDVLIGEHHDVPAIFAGFLHFFGVDYAGLRISANARARSEPPLQVNAVSPIALKCDDPCQAALAAGNYPWPVDGSTPQSFQFTKGLPEDSTFTPIALPNVDTTNFSTFVSCDPTVAGSPNCNQQDAESSNVSADGCLPAGDTPPCWYPRVTWVDPDTTFNELSNDLQAAGAYPHLVAIYDRLERLVPGDTTTPAFYHVVGWASYSFTATVDLGPGGVPQIQLDGTFHKLFLDSSKLSSSGQGGGNNDFGVRALGLSQ